MQERGSCTWSHTRRGPTTESSGALLAGVMGMNFKLGIFDHTIGFWVTLAVMGVIASVPLVVAKTRRWI